MADYNSLIDLFDDIAKAIRAKTGSEDYFYAKDFPEEIQNIGAKDFVFNSNATINDTQKTFNSCVYNGTASSNQNYVTYSNNDFYTQYIIFLKVSTSGNGYAMTGYVDFLNNVIVQSEGESYWAGDATSGWYSSSDVVSQKGLNKGQPCYIPTNMPTNKKFIYIAVGTNN